MFPVTRRRQRGFVFKLIHSMLIVIGIVTLVLLYKAGKIPFLQYRPSWTPVIHSSYSTHETSPRLRPVPVTTYVQQNDAIYEEDSGYTAARRFAVQVAAGYDSRQLYSWRDELIRDGYDAYIVSVNTPRGLMLKLRIGAYARRTQAEALRAKIIRRYPQSFSNSFIVEGE